VSPSIHAGSASSSVRSSSLWISSATGASVTRSVAGGGGPLDAAPGLARVLWTARRPRCPAAHSWRFLRAHRHGARMWGSAPPSTPTAPRRQRCCWNNHRRRRFQLLGQAQPGSYASVYAVANAPPAPAEQIVRSILPALRGWRVCLPAARAAGIPLSVHHQIGHLAAIDKQHIASAGSCDSSSVTSTRRPASTAVYTSHY